MVTWSEDRFGSSKDGISVKRFTTRNAKGVEVSVINLGGIITAVRVPDKTGATEDIVAGYDNVTDYEHNPPYFGAVIGRVANRIAKGHLKIDDQTYQLAVNNGRNHLHGGNVGFDKKIWDTSVEGNVLTLSYTSSDGEENYPGELTVRVSYQLTEDNELKLHYAATTSKTTAVNLTNHAYFNLGGHDYGNVYDHIIQIHADHFTPKDETSIPTGEISSVAGTVFDLRKPTSMGEHINNVPGDIGYDHNFCINIQEEKTLVARAVHENSGRVLEVFSNQPGVQFYTANYVDGIKGKGGAIYEKHCAFCLETQKYPDAVNQPSFPSAFLEPGEKYNHVTWFKFTSQK